MRHRLVVFKCHRNRPCFMSALLISLVSACHDSRNRSMVISLCSTESAYRIRMRYNLVLGGGFEKLQSPRPASNKRYINAATREAQKQHTRLFSYHLSFGLHWALGAFHVSSKYSTLPSPPHLSHCTLAIVMITFLAASTLMSLLKLCRQEMVVCNNCH